MSERLKATGMQDKKLEIRPGAKEKIEAKTGTKIELVVRDDYGFPLEPGVRRGW